MRGRDELETAGREARALKELYGARSRDETAAIHRERLDAMGEPKGNRHQRRAAKARRK